MTSTKTLPFSIGPTCDPQMAGDGESLYGHYIRDAVARDPYPWEPDEEDDRKHKFAELAWRAGTVMRPRFVRYHHLITDAKVYRSCWDGGLLASVTLATPPPATLALMHQWADWPTEPHQKGRVPVAPHEEQIGKRLEHRVGYALTTVNLQFGLHPVVLPALPCSPDSTAMARTAAVMVGALVVALNDIVTPVIDAL